jgi:hypothetical protein
MKQAQRVHWHKKWNVRASPAPLLHGLPIQDRLACTTIVDIQSLCFSIVFHDTCFAHLILLPKMLKFKHLSWLVDTGTLTFQRSADSRPQQCSAALDYAAAPAAHWRPLPNSTSSVICPLRS